MAWHPRAVFSFLRDVVLYGLLAAILFIALLSLWNLVAAPFVRLPSSSFIVASALLLSCALTVLAARLRTRPAKVRSPRPARLPARLPAEIWALFAVRLVVSAGSFVGPFLTMMLTIKMDYDEARAGVFMAGVSVISALGLVAGGKLGDSFSRPRVLWILQTITAALFMACAVIGFSPVTPFIIAAAMGTLSGTWPVINALVADRSPPDRRKEAFSLLYWGNNVGFSIGPLVAGFLFDKAPRSLFAGNAVALLAAAAVVIFFAGGMAAKRSKGPDAEEAAEQSGAPSPRGGTSVWAVLSANPILTLYGLSAVLVAFVYNQHTFALPLFLKDVLGPSVGPKAYGLTMTANGVTVVAATALVAFMSRRMAPLAAVALASVFYAVGFGGYYFSGTVPLVILMTSLWTIGEILGATNGNAFIAERAPPAHRSRINAVISLCYTVGNTLSPLVAGPLVRALGSAMLWPIVALLSLVSAAAVFGIHRLDTRLRA